MKKNNNNIKHLENDWVGLIIGMIGYIIIYIKLGILVGIAIFLIHWSINLTIIATLNKRCVLNDKDT